MNKKYTEADIIKLLEIVNRINVASLNETMAKAEEPDTCELGDMIQDNGPSPQDLVENAELNAVLIKAINNLSPRQAKVIKMRFGFETGVPMTLDEVGSVYGVSRERIRQIERQALHKLRWLLICKYKILEDYR